MIQASQPPQSGAENDLITINSDETAHEDHSNQEEAVPSSARYPQCIRSPPERLMFTST